MARSRPSASQSTCFAHVRVGAPEPFERAQSAERIGHAPGRQEPVERRRQVVVLTLETIHPVVLIRPGELRLGFECQAEKVLGVTPAHGIEQIVRSQAIECVLPDRLQHREADIAVVCLASNQAPADEGLQVREKAVTSAGDRARIGESGALAEDGQRAVQVPLLVGQALVAPVNRGAQRALALRQIDRALHLERKPFLERTHDLRGRQDDEPGRDELDREGESVEPAADLVDRIEGVGLEYDAARRGELAEQCRRVLERERSERKHPFARKPERHPARGQNLQVWGAVEQRRDVNGRGREMLEVVEIEERPGSVEPVPDGVEERLARLSDAERAGYGARHEVCVRDRGQTDEVDWALRRCACRHLERQAALPCAAGPCDRDDSSRAREQLFDLRERVRSPDQAMVERGQRGGRERVERRKIVPQVRCDQLKELRGGRDVSQTMPTQ